VEQQHLPWDECQTAEYFLDDVTRDLGGEALGLSVYCATSFRFGEQCRTLPERLATRSATDTAIDPPAAPTWGESSESP
jgi:hypothetical protein